MTRLTLAIRRWWFYFRHPEFCDKCGGLKTEHAGKRGAWWQCRECWARERREYRERALARHRELFGGRKS